MKNLTILQMNDIHGYLELHNELYYNDQGITLKKAGGLSRIKKLADELRKEKDQILFLDNGDTIHGTYEAVKSEGADFTPLLNKLKIDAMTFHWDIAYGPDVLKEREQELDYPLLAINVYHENTDELYMDPYLIKEISGIKVGIIGVACNIIDKTMPKHFSEGLYFTNGKEELPHYIEEVREQGAEIVILLSHLGFPQDMTILSEIRGIDVCISGHTHNRIRDVIKVNDTYIIQSGSHGSFLGRLDLSVKHGRIAGVHHELIDISEDLEEDQEFKDMISEIMSPHREYLDQIVGKTDVILHRGTSLECPMDNLLLKALLHETGAEMAFSNGWRYGAPIDKGPVKMRDLHQIIPVNPPVSLVEITGKELLKMMEENLENTYSRDPLSQMGGYVKRALGIKVFFKVENAEGQRVQEMFVGSEKLDPEKTYRATYVTNQGVPKKYGSNHEKLSVTAIDALENYLGKETFSLTYADTYVLI
ncbi:MAG TPA: bifunctional metallophosphatase/5'-nucleotidase [Bacteroidales bacterium]|nr:bifunctional metallophosphatase/5'-nucleotidase [Bacteroidales bacterium]